MFHRDLYTRAWGGVGWGLDVEGDEGCVGVGGRGRGVGVGGKT